MSMEPKEFLQRRALERLDSKNPSNSDLAAGIKVLVSMMWSKEQLEAFVDNRHSKLCAVCPRIGRRSTDGLSLKLVAVISSLIGLLGSVLGYFLK